MSEGIWGWDEAIAPLIPQWRKVLVNALGHLQVDVVTAGPTTGHCYGWDLANWQPLRVESALLHNLRVRLYGGANAVLVGQSSAALAYTNYGIETFATLYADDGTNLSRVGMLLVGADAVDNALYTLGTASMLYGYNGATWDRLRMESAAAFNLRVKLYDGANGIDSDELDSVIVTSGDRGILTRSQVCGYNLEPFHQRRTDADALAAVARELCQMNIALLYGYNGATFDRLRTESAAAFNLRVKLYDGVNGIDSQPLGTTIIPDAQRGLTVNAALRLSQSGAARWFEWRGASSVADGKSGEEIATVALWGFNGNTWDRLRTWGLGVQKVGRAEIDSTTLRKTVTGAVVGGSHNLYWISCSPDGPGSEFELTDAIAGGGAVVFDHFDPDRHSEVIHLDPPMKFTTGIWIEKFDHIKSLVFCYV